MTTTKKYTNERETLKQYSEMNYKIGHATEFSEAEIISFKKIVIEADEVKEETFDGLIRKNPILLFVPNTSNIDAVGALKIPNNSYKNKIFIKSKSKLNPEDFNFELGWIVSLKEEQGIGKMLTEVLSKYKAKIYATVREENRKMQYILQKYGFRQSGILYVSDRGDYQNMLFVKD